MEEITRLSAKQKPTLRLFSFSVRLPERLEPENVSPTRVAQETGCFPFIRAWWGGRLPLLPSYHLFLGNETANGKISAKNPGAINEREAEKKRKKESVSGREPLRDKVWFTMDAAIGGAQISKQAKPTWVARKKKKRRRNRSACTENRAPEEKAVKRKEGHREARLGWRWGARGNKTTTVKDPDEWKTGKTTRG